jgi:UDP-N-acetylmuramoyl-L-alanyl-D-glutamate--2,6-diaminopimelate ligase
MWQITANVYYGFPGRRLTVIGVTGTDGKTTTVNLIYHILKTAGKEVSMISTVGAKIHGEASPLGFHVTNPSSFPLQKFLKLAVSKKNLRKEDNYLVLEVSSHGIDQYRIWGVPITLGLITNITHEHLDYHKNYENYAKTKIQFLNSAKIRLFNRDEESYNMIKQHLNHTARFGTFTFGLTKGAEYTPEKIQANINWNSYNLFTRYNILGAISACSLVSEVSNKSVEEAIRLFVHPTGRQDIVYNKLFTVMIDFAHTPNALEQILSSSSCDKKYTRIISLIGCEGYRDPNKRAKMGEIAKKFSDIVIITAVDPRGLIEDINKQILEGVQKEKGIIGKNVFIENDRQKAITLAVSLAKKGDIIGIFGKGHEQSMNLDGKHEIHWSDYKAVEKALKKRGL